jgi:hypothetical protein
MERKSGSPKGASRKLEVGGCRVFMARTTLDRRLSREKQTVLTSARAPERQPAINVEKTWELLVTFDPSEGLVGGGGGGITFGMTFISVACVLSCF